MVNVVEILGERGFIEPKSDGILGEEVAFTLGLKKQKATLQLGLSYLNYFNCIKTA